ncbi:MAG TPA: immunoglobulin domain-containing protein [Verrucomicrobiae bacterium]|nr:immunoglobulin domain-containing protein [Verrucomicrobiae bacterium]
MASHAATYVVTTTNDSGTGSFRQAILNANSDSGTDVIAFNLPGAGPFTIVVQSALPTLTNPVAIDGATQPGYAGTPIVELNGASAGTNANGLYLTGGNSLVRGLLINQFAGFGIGLDGPGGNVIQGNYIGVDFSGTLNQGNAGAGVYIGTASGNTIGGAAGQGNLIAFNGGAGVSIGSGSNNLIRANSILMNADPAIDLGGAGNHFQAAPTLTSITASGSATVILGHLISAPNSTFQIDFYSSPIAGANGGGESQTYLGSTNINTDATGKASFSSTFAIAIPAGSYMSATATDPSNNTSPFSNGLQFTPVSPVALSISLTASTNAAILGEQFSYSITVTNSGTNAATGITVTDGLPASLNYVYAVSSQGTINTNGPVVMFNLGEMAPGARAMMTVYVSSQGLGFITNTVTLLQDQYNLNNAASTASAVVDIYQPAPPSVTKQPTPQLINLGGLLNLVVNVLGPPDTRYQWRLNGANIPGATNSAYTRPSLLASDCGTYTVVVEDSYGATLSQEALVSLNGLINLPGADNFAQRIPIVNLLGLISYNNINATSEPGEPMHAGIPGGKSIWFTWTPLLSGVATFDTLGSSFDTLLAVYTGNQLTNLTEVASSDDAEPYYRSRVAFNAVAGTTYSIAVDGAYGASGIILLNTAEDILSAPVPHIASRPGNQVVAVGGTATFSIPPISGASYQWYVNDVILHGATGPVLQITNVTSANVGYYRVQATVGGKSALSDRASLQISMLGSVADTQAIVLDKFQGLGYWIAPLLGGGQTVQTQTNQAKFSQINALRSPRASQGPSRGYSSTQIFSTYADGTQSGEPFNCDNPGGSSAWTSVQAVDTGVMEIDTDGSNFATTLGVYTGNGNDFSSLRPVACDVTSGRGGTNSMVTFAASSNTTYYVAVDGVNGAYGTAVLNANLSVPPTIGSQPASQTVRAGSAVTLTATVSGYPTPSCQWWRNGYLMAGQTNGSLTVSNFQFCSCGNYQMTAANNIGSAATTPASLLLNGPMHLDQAGVSSANHMFQMRLIGYANTNYVLLASTNMITWAPIATNSSPTGLLTFTDPQSTNFVRRYYRAKPQ